MSEINGAKAVISILEKLGVEIIFGYPGGANLPLYDALYHSKTIKHVLSRHEQGASFMASGYARIKGKVGVCFATSGPGVTNLVTGLADAYLDSIPILAITGQIPRDFIGTDAFQEVDTFNITSPITKHNELIYDHKDLVPAVYAAFDIASTGRQGPVLIDIPRDVQEKKDDYDLNSKKELLGYKPTFKPHIGQIKRTLRALKRSSKPVIIIGGGIHAAKAKDLLLQFAENTKTPVVRTLMGKGIMPEDHPLYIGMIGTHGHAEANRIINQSDLVIAIGTRLGDRSTLYRKGYFLKDAVLVHIDIDPAEISKNMPADVPVVGDIQQSLISLLKEINIDNFQHHKPWFSKKNNTNLLWKGECAESIDIVLKELSAIDKKIHLTTDVGRHQMWVTHCCDNPLHWPIITSGGLGTMGYGLPAAIGCWFADPKTPVVNVSGDGSFFMNMQEFITAVENKVNLTVLIINDQRLGMIHEIQEVKYSKRSFANIFEYSHDFVSLAKSMGGEGYKITDHDQIKRVLRQALDNPLPTIIDFDLYKVAANQHLKLKAV